jgi:hypothetical protein
VIERHLSVLVCDDIRTEVTQKLILIGVYPTHIVIPHAPHQVPQLVFMITAESDVSDPMTLSAVEITFPEHEIVRIELPASGPLPEPQPGTTRWYGKFPVTVGGPTLRPGKITVRLFHEKGAMEAPGPWIITAPHSPVAQVAVTPSA